MTGKRSSGHPPSPATTDDADDAALFRQAIGPVREIQSEEPAVSRPRPKPRARQFELDEAKALEVSRNAPFSVQGVDAAELLEYRRPHITPGILKKLKRGQFAVEDELDLHGMNSREAQASITRFLHEARDAHHRCVRIIHGKGLRSESGPVLKRLTDQVLRHAGDVLAFASARNHEGGSGAVLVLLRR